MRYSDRIKKIFSPSERKIFSKLSSPQKIQDYLDALPINFEIAGETYMSPRRMLAAKTAHCFEGALLAATALAYHGQKPFLMDLRTVPDDEDHVVALFTIHNHWGAISKTNHAVLRYRDPIFRTPRELASSYFHEYTKEDGRKTLREYSSPFDLSRYAPEKWIIEDGELFWLVEALDAARHFPLIPKKNLRQVRRATKFEIDTICATEWKRK